MKQGFWTFNIGHVLTVLTILIGLAAAHEAQVRTMAGVEAKVDIIYRWFERDVIGQQQRPMRVTREER